MDKLGYHYDPKTRILLGSVGVQESPLEPGFWLLPPNVTLTVPPAPQAGKDLAFISNSWVYITHTEDPLPIQPDADVRSTMVVSRFQGKAALLNAGLLTQVETFFSSDAASPIEKLAWNDVLVFERLSPLVLSMGAMLNLNDTQLDQLFQAADAIKI